ncbi:phosphomethylpyrimidine synthase ThiC [Streptomyces thinghirensis]|nr:phosphomethylpyrimidine synthase ThiC [Streptomyces thinghirensis]
MLRRTRGVTSTTTRGALARSSPPTTSRTPRRAACGPGLIADANDEVRSSRSCARSGTQLDRRRFNVQTMIEGPGHVPMHKIKENIDLQQEICDEVRSIRSAADDGRRAGVSNHITSGIGAAMIASWSTRPCSAYVTFSEHLGLPKRDDVQDRRHRLQDRRPCRRPRQGYWVRRSGTTRCPDARFEFAPGGRPVQPGPRPGHGTGVPRRDTVRAEEPAKTAHFCSMCGPEFCSIRFRGQSDVNTEAARPKIEEGVAQKSEGSQAQGNRVRPAVGHD